MPDMFVYLFIFVYLRTLQMSWFNKENAQNEPKTLGQIGEELARLEYEKRGYKVIAANFFNRNGKRLGEVDFIARSSDTIIFAEVKTRAVESGSRGTAAEAVDRFKQIKLLKAIKVFLQKEPRYQKLRPQIDVVSIILKKQPGLQLAQVKPAKYTVKGELDKLSRCVTIIPNAVEDWN